MEEENKKLKNQMKEYDNKYEVFERSERTKRS